MTDRSSADEATIDAIEEDDAFDASQSGKRSLWQRLRAEPLLPEAGAGGAPLTTVIAVMSFLAALAMSALLMINAAASAWTTELRSELTVQIKGADADEIKAGAEAAMRILNETDGVTETVLRTTEETAELLEPWLGKDNAAAFLTIPAIIEVKATPEARANLDLLRNRLSAAAPGATLDDHASWHGRLASTARSGQALAFTVFLLVMGAACAISAFAARAGLAANHEIVSVLHLVGATDEFIAREVQRRFFVLGLRGSLAGLIAAFIALALAAFTMRATDNTDAFLPALHASSGILLWLLIVPIVTCLFTALTARMTVLRALQDEF